MARLLADWAKARGLETRVIPVPGSASRGEEPSERAALWVRVPGRGSARPLILLSHLDVVPAAPGPDRAPGTIADGVVYGRGALDAKGIAVIHLMAAARLAERQRPLGRDVIVLSVPDEETGGQAGAGWLTRERPDLVAGAEYLLGEGGGIAIGGPGQPDLWGVGFAEKVPCWLKLRARAESGHPAVPDPEGAVPLLLDALERVRQHVPRIEVAPEVARSFRHLADLAPAEDREGWRDLAAALRDPEFRRRFLADPGRAAMVQDTTSITTLEGSSGINQTASEAFAGLDVRLVPGGDCTQHADALRARIDDPRVEVSIQLAVHSSTSPTETGLMEAIRRTARLSEPGAVVAPTVQLGSSDAHWFRRQGVIAYGFVPRRLRPIDTRGIHGPNERIRVATLNESIELLIRLLEELDTGD